MKKLNIKFYEVIFLFLVSLTPLLWLSSHQLILGHDSGFRLDPVSHIINLFYSWNTITNFGIDWSFFKGFLVTQFPEAFFTLVTHSLWWGQELTFIFWFLIMGLSMYICVNGFFSGGKFSFLRIFSSVMYMYNFFILQGWFIAERAKFSVYAALPLGFLILYNALQKKISPIKASVLFSVIFFLLNGGGNPPLYGGLLITYATTIIFLTLVNSRKEGIKSFYLALKLITLIIITAVFLNAYWFLPQAYLALHSYSSQLASTGGINGILDWENVISKHANIVNLLRMQGMPDWYENPLHPYSNIFLNNALFILLSFIPFGIVLLGLISQKKAEIKSNYLIRSMFLILILGVLFTGGSHMPFGFIYEILILHVPGFAIFRSAYYKFSPALFFSLSFLVGYYLNYFLQTYLHGKNKILFSSLPIIILLLYSFPFFTVNFFEFNKPFTTKVSIPSYVQSTFAYLNRVNKNGKLLVFPELDPSFNADSYGWGYWSLDILPRVGLTMPVIASDSTSPLVKELYAAIANNNQDEFILLARKIGITKILWRGDVLYSGDKITTSQEVNNIETNLKHMPAVSLDKTFGKWKIYSLSGSSSSIFSLSNEIVPFAGSDLNIGKILPLMQGENNKIVFENGSVLNPENNTSLIEASCDMCQINSINNLVNQLVMPSVRFLPWSRAYSFFVSKKEKNLLDSTSNLPQQRIDTDLSFSNIRLVEIWRMAYKDFNANAGIYIKQNVERYKSSINDAVIQVNKLSGKEKNDYLIRLIAYLTFQRQYIQFFNQNKLIVSPIDNTTSFINHTLSLLTPLVWISTSNENTRSFLSIPTTGDYNFFISGNSTDTPHISMDGVYLTNLDGVKVTKGEHKIEVDYPIQKNSLITPMNMSRTINISNSSSYELSFNSIDYTKNYYISFHYSIPKGNNIVFSIIQNNKTQTWEGNLKTPYLYNLIGDGQQHNFSYVYSPHMGATQADIVFSSKNRSASLSLEDISAERMVDPLIYLIPVKESAMAPMPKIRYKKLDSTAYVVTVDNATSPYVLTMLQTYNPGWKVYVLPSPNTSILYNLIAPLWKSHISENNHFPADGYANGWYMNQKGSYTLLVDFIPQQYFYLGIIVTIGTMAIIAVYIIAKLYGKKRE